MRIALVGGAGVLGGHVRDAARDRGVEAVVLSRVTIPSLDVREPAAVDAALDAASPDVVVNLAAMTDVAACEREPDLATAVNVHGAAAVARWASARRVRLVHVSTDAVFDGERGWYREEDRPAPVNVYGATKLRGERLALEGGHVVARVNYVGSGPRFFLRWAFDELRQGHTISGFVDDWFSPLGTSTLAEALLDLAVADASGLFHLAGRERVSKHEVCLAVRDLVGRGDVLAGHLPQEPVRRPRDTTLDSSLARTVINIDDRGWRASVRQAVRTMEGAR